jgi:hypothetical protein
MDYNLMSPFTAFVAVDALRRTAGDYGTTVAVPVPVPDGVRYETTVMETEDEEMGTPKKWGSGSAQNRTSAICPKTFA